MYHSVCGQKGHLHLGPELLDAQCAHLKKHGWRAISLAEAEDCLVRNKRIPRKACLFTFDDGYLDTYVYAEPILRAHGFHGVVFPVLNLVEKGTELRPDMRDLAAHPEQETQLRDVNATRLVLRSGYRVRNIRFCNWEELRHMREKGNMDAAPHSEQHDRVVSRLDFRHFYHGQGAWGFFAVTPYSPPLGMPMFYTDYALSTRGYKVNPDLFSLVKDMVPQEPKAAQAFLREPGQRQKLVKAIRSLPILGTRESEEEFRARVFTMFTNCRERFAKELGVTPLSFCWPWGAYCQESIEEAERAGFRLLFCTSQTQGCYRKAVPALRVGARHHTTPEKLLFKARFFSWKPAAAAYQWQIRHYPEGIPWLKMKMKMEKK